MAAGRPFDRRRRRPLRLEAPTFHVSKLSPGGGGETAAAAPAPLPPLCPGSEATAVAGTPARARAKRRLGGGGKPPAATAALIEGERSEPDRRPKAVPRGAAAPLAARPEAGPCRFGGPGDHPRAAPQGGCGRQAACGRLPRSGSPPQRGVAESAVDREIVGRSRAITAVVPTIVEFSAVRADHGRSAAGF